MVATKSRRSDERRFSIVLQLVSSRSKLAQFQSSERKQREHQRGDPKSDDDFGFAPSFQLEVMVQRRHLENPFAAQLKTRDLQDYRDSLGDKHASNREEQQFLLDDDSDRSDSAAQRERAHIAHEDFSGMRVVPQKANASPDHRTAENRYFGHVWDVLNFEVAGEHSMTGDIGQYR